MKPQELVEMVGRISRLKGFRAILATSANGTVCAQWNADDIGHGRLEEAFDIISGESTRACSKMGIGEFVRAEIDVDDGHAYVAVNEGASLITLFDSSATESAMTGKMDDIFEDCCGAQTQ